MIKFFVRLLQLLIVSAPLALFAFLLVQELVPSGIFIVRHRVDELSPFIDRVLPDVRALSPRYDADGDMTQPIVGDPAYFFVHPHRPFDSVEAEIWFKNEGVPIVELGALASTAGEVYDLQPLQNLIIDQSKWHRIESDGVVLLQREPTFESIDAFLADLPERGEIATYHYDLKEPYRLEGYAPSNTARTVDVSLRGFHEFYTYIKDETLRFDIQFMDMNRRSGEDPVKVLVISESGVPVAEARLADDGDVTDGATPSAMRSVTVQAPGLTEGVYKVQLIAETDVFFRTITTTQQKLTFVRNAYLGDEVAYKEPARAVRLWTEGKHVRFSTQHADAMQEVSVGDEVVRVVAPYVEYRYEVAAEGLVEVMAPRGDLSVRTDGLIAFAPDQYFNPDPVRLGYNTNLDRLGVNYVIAEYVAPVTQGNWLVARVQFDTSRFAPDTPGTWKFAFSTPGIDEVGKQLLLGEINMTWTREPFVWEDVWEYVSRVWTN